MHSFNFSPFEIKYLFVLITFLPSNLRARCKVTEWYDKNLSFQNESTLWGQNLSDVHIQFPQHKHPQPPSHLQHLKQSVAQKYVESLDDFHKCFLVPLG